MSHRIPNPSSQDGSSNITSPGYWGWWDIADKIILQIS